MSYGQLTFNQRQTIARHVVGKVVHDLGAGDLTLALDILVLGARRVYAVDVALPMSLAPGLMRVESEFANYTPTDLEVAFVSWPASREIQGLIAILAIAPVAILLIKNTDGTLCGWPGLYRYLRRRHVIAEAPDRANTLVVYGHELPTGTKRELLREERAGIDLYNVYEYGSDKPIDFSQDFSQEIWK